MQALFLKVTSALILECFTFQVHMYLFTFEICIDKLWTIVKFSD